MSHGAAGQETFERLAHAWWDDDVGVFASLRFFVNPVRLGWFRRVLRAQEAAGRPVRRVLDVGCGGGILSEELARLGCEVAGVDPVAASLAVARRHAQQGGLAIDYRLGVGEALPFADGSLDVVVCCDVLEHVEAIGPVLAEAARVLRPGGLFLYDTINRTLRSKLAVIKVMQEWPATAFPEAAGTHEHRRFIRPAELRAALARAGLEPGGVQGFGPRAGGLTCLRGFRRRARGELTFRALGELLRFGELRSTAVSYMGWAVRQPAGPALRLEG